MERPICTPYAGSSTAAGHTWGLGVAGGGAGVSVAGDLQHATGAGFAELGASIFQKRVFALHSSSP